MLLEIHDTTGDEKFRKNRTIQYLNADVFMICVPVAMKEEELDLFRTMDYKGSIERWKAEIQSVHEDRPIFLVLTKSDLSNNLEIDEPVTVDLLKQ